MKVQSVFFSLPKLFFTLSFLALLSSCSSYTQQASHSNSAQMGDSILSAANNRPDKSQLQIAEIITELTTSTGAINLTEAQINTSAELYNEGLLSAVGNEDFERLSLLKSENQSVKTQKVQTLFTLFPKHAKSIALNLTKYGIYELDELLEVALSSNLDPSIILQATASGESPDIKRIGWGGSGAFSSVVEYNGDIYASSDVTGIWRHKRPHWHPVVKGLTNYNITGLLVHNNTLLAATKKQILKLGDDNVWSPIGLELNTYRSTTLQLHSTSANGTTCFAALEPKLGCVDEQGNVTKQDLSVSKLKGVYFSEDNDYIYGFNANNLYRLNILDGSHTVEYTFPKNILRIAKLNNDSEPLIFTQKGIYELGSFAAVNIDLNNKSIVNILIDSSPAGRHFVALGGQWNSTIHKLAVIPYGLSIGPKINIVYDTSLPYRQWRKSMTKPIGMPHTVKGKMWFSDYWGIYAYDVNSNQFYEKSYDASNFVGTDIHIANDKLYITAMDNGLVSMPLNRPNKFTTIFPRKSSDWLLAGHAWSVASNNEGVFATLSPWNLSQDYLLTADSDNDFQNVQKIDDSTTRKDTSTFWGQSYSRKLILSDDIFIYKDGINGGLYKLKTSPREHDNDIQDSTSEKVFATERNRVYRALTIYNGLLVSYHIDEQKTLHFNDIATGELVKKIDAPVGLWAFDLEVIDGSLYLLGARGGAVIYKFNELDETFTEIVKVPTASAFLSIKRAPDNSLTIAGAIDWTGKPTGKVLLNKERNDEWIDITCKMPNGSGVVDIEFTSDNKYVYLLQQVGSIVRIAMSALQNYEQC